MRFWYLITYVQKPSLNANISSRARSPNPHLSLNLLPYLVYASNNGPGELEPLMLDSEISSKLSCTSSYVFFCP